MTLIDYVKDSYPSVTPTIEQINLANDIEKHREIFKNHFLNDSINIIIDQSVFKDNENTKRYHIIKGSSMLLALLSILIIYFSWKIALLIAIISFVVRNYANVVLKKGGDLIRGNLKKYFQNNKDNEALIAIWFMFGKGQIAFQTKNRTSVIPQMPSKCL